MTRETVAIETLARLAIEQLGYYPNTYARALVSGRSRKLGVMVSEIVNPLFPETLQRFVELGAEHNYEVLLSSLGQDSRSLEIAARQMIERRVDGVALLTLGREESLIDVFTRRKVPVFAVDIDSSGPLLKTVQIDYQHGVRQAVQHLAALGNIRIAIVSGPAHLKTEVMRKIAFRECMKEIGLEIPSQLLLERDHTMAAGMKAMSALAALPDRPSAVVCSNDLTAIGVMREAFELDLHIPRDLSVVGFDDARLAHFTIPPLTTVEMSQKEIANVGFRELLGSVEPKCYEQSRQAHVISTDLVLRLSTALAPGRIKVRAAGNRADESARAEKTLERSGSRSLLV